MTKKFVIVKHAGPGWDFYFEEDPKLAPVHPTMSAHYTYSGKQSGIKSEYDVQEEAQEHCDELNHINPCGDYAVCEVIQNSPL